VPDFEIDGMIYKFCEGLMTYTKRPVFLRLSLLLALAVLALSAYAAQQYSQQEILEQTSQCIDCHDDKPQSLTGTPHFLSDGSEGTSKTTVGCINCHEGWETHLEDPSEETITDISSLTMANQANICSGCHVTAHQVTMTTTDPHNRADMSCTDCHTIHANKNESLLKEDLQDFCISCHSSTAAEFNRRSAHPFESENISCVDCHFSTEMESFQPTIGLGWNCQKCHTDLAGPHVYEHPVTYDFYVNGGGCTECHEPHGSNNDRLLKQPGSGICLQCHGTPPGHITNHSGLGSKLACVECHSEIHGSYDNRLFLDPNLGSKLFPDCYQSGCHSTN